MVIESICLALGAFATFGGVYLIKSTAPRLGLVDIPNARSSHAVAVPRGGGLAFLVCFAAAVLAGLIPGEREASQVFWVYIPVLIIGFTGFADDLYSLSAKKRFALYLLCSCLSVQAFVTGGSHSYILGDLLIVAGLATLMTATINAYNFMDGINGIAGFEALFILLSSLTLTGFMYPESFIVFVVMGSVLGFLFWNFPVARIFMGDAGSTFLGAFVFIVLLDMSMQGLVHWATGFILGAAFLADTGYTLLYRIWSGQRWFAAHRSHGYQVLAQTYASHTPVVLILTIVNVLVLLPLALLVNTGMASPVLCLSLAYIPLIVAMHKVGAGRG